MSAAALSRRAATPTPPAIPVTPRTKPHKADALMWAALAYTWVSIWRFQEVIAILGKIKMPIFVQLAVVVLFFADQKPGRKVKWIKSPLLTLIFCLMGMMFLGLPTSLVGSQGLQFILREYSPYLFVMVVIATSIRDMADVEWYAFAHLMSAGAFALYAYVFCPLDWNGRLVGVPFYDGNDFALLMNCTMPFAIFFLRPGVKTWKKLLALCAIGLFVLMIIRTGSRGGFLGLMTISLYVLLRYNSIPKKYRIGAVVAGLVVMLSFGSDRYWKMMETILKPKEDYNMTDETGRKKVWLRGISYTLSHPITGVGVRGFSTAEGVLSPVARARAEQGRGIKWSVAHNSFVETAAELGIPGIIIFVSMIGYTIYSMGMLKVAKKKVPWFTPEERAFGQTLVGTFLGFCVSGFFVSAEYFSYLYMTFGFVLGFSAMLRKRIYQTPRAPRASVRAMSAPGPLQGPPASVPQPALPPVSRPKWLRPQWVPKGS